jgi:predicted nucleic acid-binding protein
MTQLVFADTGYWIAMFNPDDALHEKAIFVAERLGHRRIVTSEMVLVEFLNGAARRGLNHRKRAVDATRKLIIDTGVEIVPQTSQQFQDAVERYGERLDQPWSLTDCASFLIMERRDIQEALAHDRDFVAAGFAALLRDD